MGEDFGARVTLEINYPRLGVHPPSKRRYSIDLSNWDVAPQQLVEEMLKPLAYAAGYTPQMLAGWFGDDDE